MDLVDIIVGLFLPDIGGNNASAFDKVAANIYTMPLPDLLDPEFRAQNAVMWALGIIIGIVVGFLAATFALGRSIRSIGSPVSVATRITFFLQVAAVGFVATPIIYLAVLMADALSDASQIALNRGAKETSWLKVIVDMFNRDSGLDYIIKETTVWLIDHQVTVIQQLIPIMVMCTSAAFAFSALGNAGKAFWKGWWAVMLTVIFAKPALAWLFSLTAWAVSNSPTPDETSMSLLALMMAAITPFVLLWLFAKKTDPPIHPMLMASGNSSPSVTQHQGDSGSKFLAPLAGALGWAASDHAKKTEKALEKTDGVTHRTPGSRRVAAANFGGTKAIGLASAHPLSAAVLGVGSAFLGSSGKRSAVKSTRGATNAPPNPHRGTPTPPLPAAQPPTPRPASQRGPGQTVNPSIPSRAPHEMPIPSTRPSLGRKKS